MESRIAPHLFFGKKDVETAAGVETGMSAHLNEKMYKDNEALRPSYNHACVEDIFFLATGNGVFKNTKFDISRLVRYPCPFGGSSFPSAWSKVFEMLFKYPEDDIIIRFDSKGNVGYAEKLAVKPFECGGDFVVSVRVVMFETMARLAEMGVTDLPKLAQPKPTEMALQDYIAAISGNYESLSQQAKNLVDAYNDWRHAQGKSEVLNRSLTTQEARLIDSLRNMRQPLERSVVVGVRKLEPTCLKWKEKYTKDQEPEADLVKHAVEKLENIKDGSRIFSFQKELC